MNSFKGLFAAGISVLCVCSAHAQTATGQITGYIPFADSGNVEIIFVRIENNPVGGCNTTGRFVMRASDARFRATRAAVIAAFHAQTPVTINYSQTCKVWENSWDMNYMCVGSTPC
jgi:hypothetical protein